MKCSDLPGDAEAPLVRTFLRICPPKEIGAPDCFLKASESVVCEDRSGTTYKFSHVFGPENGHDEVFQKTVAPHISGLFNGASFVAFALGPASPGKIYTLYGDRKVSGLIRKACFEVSEQLKAFIHSKTNLGHSGSQAQYVTQARAFSTRVHASYMEVYNERLVYDLLAPGVVPRPGLKNSEETGTPCHVKEMTEVEGISYADFEAILAKGQARRTLATARRGSRFSQSSRSHTVFSLTCTRQTEEGGRERVGCISFVDCGGLADISPKCLEEKLSAGASTVSKGHDAVGICLQSLIRYLLSSSRPSLVCANIYKHFSLTLDPPYIFSGHDIPDMASTQTTRLLSKFLPGDSRVSIIVTIDPHPSCVEANLKMLEFTAKLEAAVEERKTNLTGEPMSPSRGTCSKRVSDGIREPKSRQTQALSETNISMIKHADSHFRSDSNPPSRTSASIGSELAAGVDITRQCGTCQEELQKMREEVQELRSIIAKHENNANKLMTAESAIERLRHFIRENIDGKAPVGPCTGIDELKTRPLSLAQLEKGPLSATASDRTKTQLKNAQEEIVTLQKQLTKVRSELESPLLLITQIESRSLMVEGSFFTLLLPSQSKTKPPKATQIFMFYRTRGFIGELHWCSMRGRMPPNGMLINSGKFVTESMSLDLVTDLHFGKETEIMRSQLTKGIKGTQCITISCCSTSKSLNIVASTSELALMWLSGIHALLTKRGRKVDCQGPKEACMQSATTSVPRRKTNSVRLTLPRTTDIPFEHCADVKPDHPHQPQSASRKQLQAPDPTPNQNSPPEYQTSSHIARQTISRVEDPDPRPVTSTPPSTQSAPINPKYPELVNAHRKPFVHLPASEYQGRSPGERREIRSFRAQKPSSSPWLNLLEDGENDSARSNMKSPSADPVHMEANWHVSPRMLGGSKPSPPRNRRREEGSELDMKFTPENATDDLWNVKQKLSPSRIRDLSNQGMSAFGAMIKSVDLSLPSTRKRRTSSKRKSPFGKNTLSLQNSIGHTLSKRKYSYDQPDDPHLARNTKVGVGSPSSLPRSPGTECEQLNTFGHMKSPSSQQQSPTMARQDAFLDSEEALSPSTRTNSTSKPLFRLRRAKKSLLPPISARNASFWMNDPKVCVNLDALALTDPLL